MIKNKYFIKQVIFGKIQSQNLWFQNMDFQNIVTSS